MTFNAQRTACALPVAWLTLRAAFEVMDLFSAWKNVASSTGTAIQRCDWKGGDNIANRKDLGAKSLPHLILRQFCCGGSHSLAGLLVIKRHKWWNGMHMHELVCTEHAVSCWHPPDIVLNGSTLVAANCCHCECMEQLPLTSLGAALQELTLRPCCCFAASDFPTISWHQKTCAAAVVVVDQMLAS